MTFVKKIHKKLVFARFAIREWWPLWFNVLNHESRSLYKRNRTQLTPVTQRVLLDLRKDGISFSSLNELFPGTKMLERLAEYAQGCESNLSISSKKEFLVSYFDLVPELDLANPFVQFACKEEVLSVAQHYLEMWPRLNYFNLAKTLPVGTNEAMLSQNWHRDSEEKRMLKVFIYLGDVDEEAGPFIYAKKSVYGSQYGGVAPQRPPEGSYPAAGVVENAIPKKEIVVATGKAGSVIFCDTSGLHKGGYAKTKERIMSTAFYTANTWKESPRYRHTKETRAALRDLSPSVQYLLEKDRIGTT